MNTYWQGEVSLSKTIVTLTFTMTFDPYNGKKPSLCHITCTTGPRVMKLHDDTSLKVCVSWQGKVTWSQLWSPWPLTRIMEKKNLVSAIHVLPVLYSLESWNFECWCLLGRMCIMNQNKPTLTFDRNNRKPCMGNISITIYHEKVNLNLTHLILSGAFFL